MASRRIAVSTPRLFFQTFSRTSKPLYSFCSSTNKPPNQENPQPNMIEDEICRIMQVDEWPTHLQTSVRNLVPLFDHNLVSSVLNRLPDRALEFFKWVEDSGFKHDRETHYKMISILCRDQRLDDAKKILLGVSEKGLGYDEDLFVLLITGYAKSDRKWDVVKNCVKIFLKMEELGVVKTIKTYNPLLEVIITNKKYTLAEKFFDQMLSEGIVPTQDTYTLMISGLCRLSRVETANKYFEAMKGQNFSPDFVVYNTLVNGYCKVKKIKEAEKIFMEMKGKGIEPLLVTYNSMINGYTQVKRLEDAEKVMEEMKEQNVEPNLITYNTMINGYSLVGKMEDAKKVVCEMKGRNIEPDIVTYITMIKGYVKANRVDEGLKLVEEMKRKRFGNKVDVNLCVSILKEALDVEEMSETQRNVLQEVEDYVERMELLEMRDAVRELSELDRMKMRKKREIAMVVNSVRGIRVC